MSDFLQKAMGKAGARQLGSDQYQLELPLDADGMGGRHCVNRDCSPGYFKIRPGTGVQGPHERAFCPYCRQDEEPSSFFTEEQKRYAIEAVEQAAIIAFGKELEGILGGKNRRFDAGMFGVSLSVEVPKPKHISRPAGEELSRSLVCPHCGLHHAVFGLAFWCPDCGENIFMEHVREEFRVVEMMLDDVQRRREQFGLRVAGKDVENCLEDTVSIFEAVMKILVCEWIRAKGEGAVGLESVKKKYGLTPFQSPDRAMEITKQYGGIDLWASLSPDERSFLKATFEKRHPITHNLGIVDKKYLEKAQTQEREGREIRVVEQEIRHLIQLLIRVLEGLIPAINFTPSLLTPDASSSVEERAL